MTLASRTQSSGNARYAQEVGESNGAITGAGKMN